MCKSRAVWVAATAASLFFQLQIGPLGPAETACVSSSIRVARWCALVRGQTRSVWMEQPEKFMVGFSEAAEQRVECQFVTTDMIKGEWQKHTQIKDFRGRLRWEGEVRALRRRTGGGWETDARRRARVGVVSEHRWERLGGARPPSEKSWEERGAERKEKEELREEER